MGRAYDKLGLEFSAEAERRMAEWRAANPPGAHGIARLLARGVRPVRRRCAREFGFYLDRFGH